MHLPYESSRLPAHLQAPPLQVVKKVAKKVAKKAVKKVVKKVGASRLKTSAPDVNIGFQNSLPFPLGQIKEAIDVLISLPK